MNILLGLFIDMAKAFDTVDHRYAFSVSDGTRVSDGTWNRTLSEEAVYPATSANLTESNSSSPSPQDPDLWKSRMREAGGLHWLPFNSSTKPSLCLSAFAYISPSASLSMYNTSMLRLYY